jgi:hypothetical protein
VRCRYSPVEVVKRPRSPRSPRAEECGPRLGASPYPWPNRHGTLAFKPIGLGRDGVSYEEPFAYTINRRANGEEEEDATRASVDTSIAAHGGT